jgi:hypothetical protein
VAHLSLVLISLALAHGGCPILASFTRVGTGSPWWEGIWLVEVLALGVIFLPDILRMSSNMDLLTNLRRSGQRGLRSLQALWISVSVATVCSLLSSCGGAASSAAGGPGL